MPLMPSLKRVISSARSDLLSDKPLNLNYAGTQPAAR
jgi:hypothetical protein